MTVYIFTINNQVNKVFSDIKKAKFYFDTYNKQNKANTIDNINFKSKFSDNTEVQVLPYIVE